MTSPPLLLIGAAGGLGRRILPRILAGRGSSVRALVHRSPLVAPGLEVVHGDVEDRSSLVSAMQGVHTVLHLAAVTHAREAARYDAVNRRGTENVAAACERAGVSRLIFVSSTAAHPEGGAYAASKWAGEKTIEAGACPYVILRPSEVYGAGSREGINRLIDWVERVPVVPVIGDGSARVCPVSVEDVEIGLLAALKESDLSGCTLTLGGPEVMTFDALIDRLARWFGVRRAKLHLSAGFSRALFELAARLRPGGFGADQVDRFLSEKSYDVESAPSLLGYAPRTLEQGLSRWRSR